MRREGGILVMCSCVHVCVSKGCVVPAMCWCVVCVRERVLSQLCV